MKFSKILEARLDDSDIALKLKQPPQVGKFTEGKFERIQSIIKDENEFMNFYLLRPVVILKLSSYKGVKVDW